jgi:hypothetical protein
VDTPRELAERVAQNAREWGRKLQGLTGPATLSDLRDVVGQIETLAEAVKQLAAESEGRRP